MAAAAADAEPEAEAGAAGEAFRTWEGGAGDVDMFCGLIGAEFLWQISHLWMMSGHRSHCNHDNVRPWVQVAYGPALLYLPVQMGSMQQLRTLREDFVRELARFGHYAHPYEAATEYVSRPKTVIRDSIVITAYDLGVMLKHLGWDQVRFCGRFLVHEDHHLAR